ncbi:GNAT family N-acetyltransferase [Helicobacter sp. MIT 05-5293]|uniref:GNAT family N-acetyltransferase n=1 Tax=Helicobacter sp. MIT 05-5293 TaxID=1548149 RepID=UPI001F53E80D|nr:GNAT family N-acetyltransferase [Helicobacter sp. MIT 05-5293]
MIHIRQYCKDSKTLWNDFNASAKNGLFMFDRNYMDYHSDRFKDHSLLFYEDEKLLALLPLNLKDDVLYSHQGLTFGGFITSTTMKQEKMCECFRILREYMSAHHIARLIYKPIPYIYHKLPAQEDLYALFTHNAHLYRVDCSSTIALNDRIALPKGRKAQISRAKRENVQIESSHNFSHFITLLNSVLSSRHHTKAVHSAQELELLSARFPESIQLFIAQKSGEMLAAALLFVYENLIHTQYLATNEQGREIGALDLLLKTLIESYATSKTYFDFGISTENNGWILNQGLIAQKEGFGGRTIVHSFYELAAGGGEYYVIFSSFLLFVALAYRMSKRGLDD